MAAKKKELPEQAQAPREVERVVERTVVWKYEGKGAARTVRYVNAATADYRELAATVAEESIGDVERAAIEEYRQACEEGKAVIINQPERRKLR